MKVKHRHDYMPPAFLVTSVALDIAIFDSETRVTSRLKLLPNPAGEGGQPVCLDGRDIALQAVRLNGRDLKPADYRLTERTLEIDGVTDACEIEVVSTCHPEKNTALEGLYLSGGMFCTQCEPEGFRRIGYFPDRPDVMTIFTVRLEASTTYPQLLSNGNLVESGQCGEGRHYVIWHDPHPKPSYLFAAVVGDLDCARDEFITASGRHVDLHIYVEKGNLGLTDHAMDSLKRSMRWDEETYGLEYDLDLFQIVAVSHFNMGAMENKGLNIFNSKFVLADPRTATDTDLHRVESIIAHEYFHNWTGNRVTCRDWFQLTLKEGLTVYRDQCFSADMHDPAIQRADDVSALRAAQFPEDRSPTAHPIRPETYREINNFYTATVYEKGAEVIRMLAGYLGLDGFRAGMDLYFARHDGQAVTCDDFVAALSDATGADLAPFLGWYRQAGTPLLSLRRVIDQGDGDLHLDFRQTIPETAANTPRDPVPIPVRVGFVGADGAAVPFSLTPDADRVEEQVILVTEQTHHQPIYTDGITAVVPSVLRQFSAPVMLDDDLSDEERLHLVAHDKDQFNRWESVQKLVTKVIGIIAQNPAADHDGLVRPLAYAISQSLANKALLDQFKAGLLALPPISVLENVMRPADPVALYKARAATQASLGRLLADDIAAVLLPQAVMTLAQSSGGRALVNRMLSLGVAAGDRTAISHSAKQALDDNMTLSQGAVFALNDSFFDERQAALTAFHDRWQDSPLVMEKWFMMEAMSASHGTVKRLHALMAHPAFDLNNPNKLRAVLGSFMAGNPIQFYAEDGSGFAFVGECLIDIDQRNPQLAARMALPLTRMAAYSDARQAQMRAVLEKVQKASSSDDLREVVDKALAA